MILFFIIRYYSLNNSFFIFLIPFLIFFFSSSRLFIFFIICFIFFFVLFCFSFFSFLSGPFQFSAHLPKIQERREDISESHVHKIIRTLFRLENIVHFISSCHSLLSPATSAPGNSLAPVGSGRLRQNAIL